MISLEGISWSGRLPDAVFLRRLYPLETMRSTDGRFSDAAGDIWQHRENNHDWEDDWIFDDPRFALRTASDEVFVAFLAEGLHPVVRPNSVEARELCARYNAVLQRDGWILREVSSESGRPVFGGARLGGVKQPATALDLPRYSRLDQEQSIREHLRRIDRGLHDDPAAAIASSKELIETTCKLILSDFPQLAHNDRDDLPKLYRTTAEALRLRAEDIPESRRGSEAAERILRALVTQVQGLGELRTAIGLGHGRAQPSPGSVRHARLAFNAATTVVEFLLDTWHERRAEN